MKEPVLAVRWMAGLLDASRGSEAFWSAVTGWPVSGRALAPADGDVFLRFGDGPVRCELHVDDVDASVSRAVTLGARRVSGGVCRSPAGIAFAMVPWRGARVRPAAASWPGGARSLVDQLCVDVPVGGFEVEAAFWAALTGWERRPVDLPEFDVLVRPAGQPLRLLLQRTGGSAAGVHVDLACDAVAVEVARHVALGASVVRRVPGDWTTLRDPAGREYCVTARSPG
jgi:hypothetical protein